jgi:DNA relaxase NicK
VIACEGIQNYQYEILFKEHHILVPKDDLVQTIKYASVTMQCI